MNEIAGHGIVAFKWFLLVWTFAAFGEEIGYRGYLLNRAADAGDDRIRRIGLRWCWSPCSLGMGTSTRGQRES